MIYNTSVYNFVVDQNIDDNLSTCKWFKMVSTLVRVLPVFFLALFRVVKHNSCTVFASANDSSMIVLRSSV